MPITAIQIAKRLGAETAPSDIEMIGPAQMSDITAMLDEAMARKSGHPFFNPKGARVKDFDMQYFRARWNFFAGNTGLQCLLVNKATGKEIISNVELWPRNDFWAVLVELSQLT